MILKVRLQPRSSAEAFGGVREGALIVRVTAPPVEGKANAALARFLGRALDVPPSAIEVVRGATGRDKLVRVAGLTASAVRMRLVSP
ncbi:MAG TPA: DUF167 domain-containing protein [Vicinamibacteria bacterium]|nr:DUF167 domain-containing protein [Vicinamibacteria bacterium]